MVTETLGKMVAWKQSIKNLVWSLPLIIALITANNWLIDTKQEPLKVQVDQAFVQIVEIENKLSKGGRHTQEERIVDLREVEEIKEELHELRLYIGKRGREAHRVDVLIEKFNSLERRINILDIRLEKILDKVYK